MLSLWLHEFSSHFKDMHIRLIGESKLAIGTTLHGCVPFYVSSVMDRLLAQYRPKCGSAPYNHLLDK